MKVYRYDTDPMYIRENKRPTVFLAGPTPRNHQTHLTSWRKSCVNEFRKKKFDGALIIPEFKDNYKFSNIYSISIWEFSGLCRADCILFWVPRTEELIGLTTNWELGYWMGRDLDKIVYGRPDDAYKTYYLDVMWDTTFREKGDCVPKIENSLEDLVDKSIQMCMKSKEERSFEKVFSKENI